MATAGPDVVSEIAAWLGQHDLPAAAIAGILGNMQIESGFRTNALNGNEGAVGLVQWEGGRLANLKAYAASKGASPEDLQTQLEFMWHELTTDYKPALQAILSAKTPQDAAAAFDQQYEGSAGTTRQQRMDAAASIYQQAAVNGYHGGAAVQTDFGPVTGDPVATAQANGSYNPQSYAPGKDATLTPDQKKAALVQGAGPLGAILTQVPELNSLLNQAVANGWTGPEFENHIDNSVWYRTHSDTLRQSIITQLSDPATYQQQLNAAGRKVSNMMADMGVDPRGLTNAQYVGLAKQVQMGTISDADLQKQLAVHFGYGSGHDGSGYTQGMATGKAATYDDQLRTMYAQYGQSVQPGQLAHQVQQLLGGSATLDQYTDNAKVAAKAMFPGLSASIDQGLTVKDIAQPYIQSMSTLLEQDPNTITLNDRLVKQALQGIPDPKTGVRASQSLTDFENTVRSDPRWQYTNNAHQATSGMLMDLGKSFGFEV